MSFVHYECSFVKITTLFLIIVTYNTSAVVLAPNNKEAYEYFITVFQYCFKKFKIVLKSYDSFSFSVD